MFFTIYINLHDFSNHLWLQGLKLTNIKKNKNYQIKYFRGQSFIKT